MEIFYSPSMTAALAGMLVLQALSLLALLINIQLFRGQSRRYRTMLASFGNEAAWGYPGRFLVPLYIVLTIIAMVVMIALFIWQPHIL